MGQDWYGKAVIGVQLDPSVLLGVPSKIKAFEHNYPEDYEFDPKTGIPLWKEVNTPLQGYNHNLETIGGFHCFFTTDNQEMVVGIGVETGTSRGGSAIGSTAMSPEEIHNIKTELEKVLAPLGLWNPDDFRLYAMLYCSY